MPSWQSRVVNCRSGERLRWAARRGSVIRLEAVEHQAGEHEVVRPVAARRRASRGWNRRRGPRAGSVKPEAVGDAGQPVEDLLDLGLDHEAARAGLLDDVADRVEADDADALRGEKGQPFGDQATGHRRPKVEVDLLRPVGCPEGGPDRLFLARVGDGDRGERVVRLAQEDAGDVAVGWPAVGPDLVERDEEVGAEAERRPCCWKSRNSSLCREMWLTMRSISTSWSCASARTSSQLPKRGSIRR